MNEFRTQLKLKMHGYVRQIYRITKTFPKEELYGTTSQLRRAALSVILNYVEGYARFSDGLKLQFYETAYGSLKESKYLIYFCFSERYLSKSDYDMLLVNADEIGKMLWSEIALLDKKRVL